MSRPKNCPDQKWFARLLDGKLAREEEAKLSRHLDQCSLCQEKLEQFSQSELLENITNADCDVSAVNPLRTLRPAVLELKLAEVRANRPETMLAFDSGYADLLPWLEEAEPNIGRIAEFELTRFVGRGGMGAVFEAHDTKLERAVAIKLMSPGLLADPNASERFLREARSAAKINHANVVTVHAVNQIRGLPYLVMELVRGKSLEQQLISVPRLPVIEVLKIARQTALGLAAAHKNGITHRDIKPSNLMLDKQSKRIRIADFGLASTISDTTLTRSGMLVGTPDFASPEQVNGQPVDARSDLFNLGCVLYLLCTGHPPFASDSLMETLDAVRSAEPNLHALNERSVPRGLIEIILRLVKKDPADRFQSADELCVALKRVSDSEVRGPVAVSFAKEKPALPRKSKTNIGYRAIGAVFLTAVFATAALWWLKPWNSISSSEPEPAVSADRQDVENPMTTQTNESRSTVPIVSVNSSEKFFEALERPGDLVVKLAPGQTFELNQPVQIESKAVRIEGDPNRLPVLWLKSEGEDASFHSENGELAFSGVSIRDGRDGECDEGLILCENGKLKFKNCIFTSLDHENAIIIQESDLELSSTVLVPQNLVGYDVGDDEHFISWEETNVHVDTRTRQVDDAEAQSIEWLIERCLNSEINSADQVRKLLAK